MDIVAVRNIAERLQDLLEAIGSCRKRALQWFPDTPLKIIVDGLRQAQGSGISHLSPSGTPDFSEHGGTRRAAGLRRERVMSRHRIETVVNIKSG